MWKSRKEYCVQDEKGRWINTEFPPDSFVKYSDYSGYQTSNREYLFYQFAVQYYDVLIEYKGNRYILVADDDGCSVTNEIWDDLSPEFLTANDLIKDFRFPDGKGLLDIVDNQDFKIYIY